jgi:hypothetical protein
LHSEESTSGKYRSSALKKTFAFNEKGETKLFTMEYKTFLLPYILMLVAMEFKTQNIFK